MPCSRVSTEASSRRRLGAGTDVEQLRQRDGHQKDDRGDDLEVQDRLGGHAPDLLRRIHARDSEHDEREDQGDDDHLNQVEEHVAGQFELLADGGGERADECADATAISDCTPIGSFQNFHTCVVCETYRRPRVLSPSRQGWRGMSSFNGSNILDVVYCATTVIDVIGPVK